MLFFVTVLSVYVLILYLLVYVWNLGLQPGWAVSLVYCCVRGHWRLYL